MAVGASTVWRVRPGGDNTNGAGFDATISGAGTDYSQQDAPQISHTDWSCLVADDAGRLVISTASTDCTSAMIGNCIRISAGTGWVVGYYFVTAVPANNKLTLDRSPANGADRTSGTGKLGGAAAFWRMLENGNATGDKAVAGNTVYIRGSGSDTPSSADYTTTSYTTGVAGTQGSQIRIIGENGRPRMQSNGLMLFSFSWYYFENLYITATSNSNGANGIIGVSNGILYNVVVNTNNQATLVGAIVSNTHVIACEFYGGTTSPTISSGAYLISAGNYNTTIIGCYIHHSRDVGVYDNSNSASTRIIDSVIYGCAGNGVTVQTSNTVMGAYLNNAIIDGNAGHGVNILAAEVLDRLLMLNCVISNNNQAGKYAINVAAGTTAANDARCSLLFRSNAFYNNTANYNALSARPGDISCSADPYTNRAGGDYTLNATAGGGLSCTDAGYPQTIKGL